MLKEEEITYPYDPEYWGSAGWKFLHAISLTYPVYPTEEDKQLYRDLFLCTGKCLPCSTCSRHFLDNQELYPIRLESRKDLAEWLVMMHNQVNYDNGKPLMTLSQVIKKEGFPIDWLYTEL